jgi:hypothetical protein
VSSLGVPVLTSTGDMGRIVLVVMMFETTAPGLSEVVGETCPHRPARTVSFSARVECGLRPGGQCLSSLRSGMLSTPSGKPAAVTEEPNLERRARRPPSEQLWCLAGLCKKY